LPGPRPTQGEQHLTSELFKHIYIDTYKIKLFLKIYWHRFSGPGIRRVFCETICLPGQWRTAPRERSGFNACPARHEMKCAIFSSGPRASSSRQELENGAKIHPPPVFLFLPEGLGRVFAAWPRLPFHLNFFRIDNFYLIVYTIKYAFD
jgi:hypothetical protein